MERHALRLVRAANKRTDLVAEHARERYGFRTDDADLAAARHE